MNSQTLFAKLNEALSAGKLNESFYLASQRMPFSIENVDFLRLMTESLAALGFEAEAQTVSAFADELVNHRNAFAEKDQADLGYNELGHSHPYQVVGKNDQWTHPVWNKRAKMIAGRIPEDAAVLDLGCGNMLIEEHLHQSVRYIPCDVGERDERTIVCDFDKHEYPADQGETHVVCLGVLPYLRNQADLLRHICARNKPFFVTFKPHELTKAKIESGVFPPPIGMGEANTIIRECGFMVGFRHVLGQGDEVLLAGTPP